jgi:hypothetical protein
VLSLFFYGQIGSNNPYPKSWKFRVRRTTKGWDDDDPWYPDKALIVLTQDPMVTLTFTAQPKDKEYITINGEKAYFRKAEAVQEFDVAIGDSIDATATNLATMVNFYSIELDCTAVASGNVVELRGLTIAPVVETPYAFITSLGASGDIHAMNPAHIIYECATNKVWGRGLPRAMIDDAAFRVAADTLYAENFGLCIRWNRQDNIDTFVQNVIDHIGGAVYVDRQTGLLKLKLIRNDYDADSMAAYTFDNGILDITEDQVSSRDTMVNEVIVSFNDPVTDKIGSVRVQNLASFQSIGSVVSQTIEYIGIATATAALRLAQRDLEMHSSQLRRLTLKMTRTAWKISPGDVIKISVPERGIESMILRVGEIEEAALTGEEITVKCVEDVFGLPDNTIVDPQESFWTPPDRSARVITDRELTEQTYFDLADNLPSSTLADFTPDEGWIKVYAAQPSGASVQYDLQTKAGGETVYATRSTAGFDAVAYLVGDISHYQTNLTFTRGSLLGDVAVGALVRIDDEYFRLDDIDRNAGTLIVARGCADTIPQLHLDKARIWFQTAMPTTDFRDYATGEVVSARLLTRTTSQTLDPAFAYEDTITMASRQGRPYPPGNMTVNSDPVFDETHIITGDIVLSWAHRDRIVQGNTLLEHGAGSTGPEPGTTYTVRVYGPDGVALLHTEAGLSGTSWTYTTAMSDGNPGLMWFRVESVRDGYTSLQYYWFAVGRPFTFDAGFDFDFDGSAG